MSRTVYFLLLFFFLSSSFSFAEETNPAAQKSFEASTSINWGPVNGFVQTPSGGRPGTSSIKRPTLDDLNIDESTYYDVLLAWYWRKSSLYVGSQFIRLSGSGILGKDIVSHGIPLSAGTPFDSDIAFDWYRLGISYSFFGQGGMPTISPKIEVAFLNFDYILDTPEGKAVRSYVKLAPRVGMEIKMPLQDIVDLKLDAATSIPFSNTPIISNVSAELGAHILPKSSIVDARIFSRFGFQRIDYEDNQELPNHVRLEIEPFIAIGVTVLF